MVKKYSERVRKALKKLSYDKVLAVYETGDFVEVVCRTGGDVSTFRVYNDGTIGEK